MSGPGAHRAPGLSVRIKLTLSYAGFLVVAGIALFAVGFLLLRFVPEGSLTVDGGGFAPNRTNLVEVFVRYAWWAMGLLVVFGLVGGWLLAGVVLRPLDRITDAARQARDGHLDHRVSLPGSRDELTDLADTFDAMLDRVQHTIDEERRFAANASHELRTPHAIIRTMVEVAQADPDGRDVDVVLQRIGATNERAIASTEALLMLARVGRGGALEMSAVDLASVVGGCSRRVASGCCGPRHPSGHVVGTGGGDRQPAAAGAADGESRGERDRAQHRGWVGAGFRVIGGRTHRGEQRRGPSR